MYTVVAKGNTLNPLDNEIITRHIFYEKDGRLLHYQKTYYIYNGEKHLLGRPHFYRSTLTSYSDWFFYIGRTLSD